MNYLTPIIHMTDNCNMACKYCYAGSAYKSFPDIEKLNEEFSLRIPLLFKFIDQVMRYNKFTPTAFFFHGGEPLLINIENWERILNYFKEKNYLIEPKVQTNGTLINNNFIRLFKKFKVKVGISLDGPGLINDQNRVLKNGKGSFSLIFRNLKKLRKAGIHFGCLVTLSRSNINNVDIIYKFFKKYKIPFNIRPISQTKYSLSRDLLISPLEYATAFCKLFDIWFEDTETKAYLISDFANLIARFIKPLEKLTICSFMKNCSNRFVSFDMNGNLWHCARLRNIPDFLYGNIKKDDLVSLLNTPKAKQFLKRWKILSRKDCKNCEVSHYCFGGCPGRALYYYGNYFKKDYYCAAFKIILKHVYERVQATL